MKKSLLPALLLPAFVAVLAFFPIENRRKPFHSPSEISLFKKIRPENPPGFSGSQISQKWLSEGPGAHGIPIDSNVIFLTGKTCGGCHGHDPNGRALVASTGEDVNMFDDWAATMMANAAKDPFWRAKVSHEILVNPAHSTELQDKCTSCHAPAGHAQAHLKEHKPHYGLADLYADTLGLDGINCSLCHAQSPESALGNLHSGQIALDTNKIRVAYGPFEFIFAPPMHNFVGVTPLYSEHMADAGVCAGCHTLITATSALDGQPTGQTFIEQATYHEWLNSRYDEAHENITCQACHMPRLQDEIIISTNYQNLTPKFPYDQHELAGANVLMLRLLKENRQQLGIAASPANFDSTIAATLRQLREKTLDLDLSPQLLSGDTVVFDLRLANRAGHKFPSGYPARRAWVEFLVENEAGDTLFHSGRFDQNFALPDENPNFEPHHDDISRPGQIQIYEMVPGDVNGSFSTVLERGATMLKDNRLTPQGFRTDDPAYDTTRIVGHARTDPDFNFAPDGTEGSGSDIVHFHVPTAGQEGRWKITARVWYQSLPPKFVEPMFAFSSLEIDSFKGMFRAADRMPILVAEQVLDSVFVSSVSTKGVDNQPLVSISPNPTADGKIAIHAAADLRVLRLKIFDASGKLVWDKPGREAVLPARKGIYVVSVETERGKFLKKIIRG